MALGPLPDVANVVRIKFTGLNQTTPWVALMFWHYLGASPTASALSTFCTAVADTWQASLVPTMHTTVSLQGVEAWDLSARTGAVGAGGTPHVGTRAGTPLPTSAAACVGWNVSYRWRGGHFRTYWPAGTQQDLVNGHIWVESARASFEAANEGFLVAMNALTLGSAGGYLTGIRYVHSVGEPPNRHPEYLVPPLDLQIRSATVDPRLDTQRRRLGPDL